MHRQPPHLAAADLAVALLAMDQAAVLAWRRRNARARPALSGRPPPGPAMPVIDTVRSTGACGERAASPWPRPSPAHRAIALERCRGHAEHRLLGVVANR